MPKPKPLTIARAKLVLEERMNDPESARYKSMYSVERTGAVCGRVNSKNRMGGYDGFKHVMVRANGNGIEVRVEGGPGFNQAFENYCSETAPGGQP